MSSIMMGLIVRIDILVYIVWAPSRGSAVGASRKNGRLPKTIRQAFSLLEVDNSVVVSGSGRDDLCLIELFPGAIANIV
jgi:hypothetical protein